MVDRRASVRAGAACNRDSCEAVWNELQEKLFNNDDLSAKSHSGKMASHTKFGLCIKEHNKMPNNWLMEVKRPNWG